MQWQAGCIRTRIIRQRACNFYISIFIWFDRILDVYWPERQTLTHTQHTHIHKCNNVFHDEMSGGVAAPPASNIEFDRRV